MRLNRDKRIAFARVVIISALICGFCWYAFVRPERSSLLANSARLRQINDKIKTNQGKIKYAAQLRADVQTGTARAAKYEEGMVRGDMYLWIIKTVRKFQIPGRLEISTYEPPQSVELKLPTPIPYPAALFTIVGNAYYFDFVEFLSLFEQTFPSIRIQKVELEPASFGTKPEDEEKLTFRIEMLALVKTTEPE